MHYIPDHTGIALAMRTGLNQEKELHRDSAMERPSGKGAGDENFPVGSWLLPARLRGHIASFYAYARAIDDIADNPDLEPQEKVWRLDRFARAVSGNGSSDPALRKAHEIRRSLKETGVTHRHCVDLTRAFKQDATKLRYDDWDDLIGYCNFSAAPVGRYLVDLHGQPASAYPASDALCNALQVLNHLQDCADDYKALNRVYLPQRWMNEAGSSVEDLVRARATPALRQVLDRCLNATGQLLALARTLPGQLRNLRFGMEAAVIVAIAEKLCVELRRRDPLAERVELGKAQYLGCFLAGTGRLLGDRIMRRFPREANDG
ncbi:MAG: squalene synthase HpnC [Gammaproteobacteria bacterium]|nr:squalene synthase HpnC [Gammaproteobacteria bacterium]